MNNVPGLFGINFSNRDFSKEKNWGKNQFNSSFPAALSCYMFSKGIKPVYIKLENKDGELKTYHDYISVKKMFNLPNNMNPDDAYYYFEHSFLPDQKYNDNPLRSDLVIKKSNKEKNMEEYLSAFEVKLTTVPDSATYMLEEKFYGCELVIRSVSIIHLVTAILDSYINKRKELSDILSPIIKKFPTEENWLDKKLLLNSIDIFKETLDFILNDTIDNQKPIIINPIWKTEGKSPKLAENCLDIFVWSSHALTRLFVDSVTGRTVDRYTRSIVWIIKLLNEYVETEKISNDTIYNLPLGHQTDKAFAVNGRKTYKYMTGKELHEPRIKKGEVSKIILGGGEKFLSPERRFDASIYYDVDIFEGK